MRFSFMCLLIGATALCPGCTEPNNKRLLTADVELKVLKAHRDYRYETALQNQLLGRPCFGCSCAACAGGPACGNCVGSTACVPLLFARYDAEGWLTLTFSLPVAVTKEYKNQSPLNFFRLWTEAGPVFPREYFEPAPSLEIPGPSNYVSLPLRLQKGKTLKGLRVEPVEGAFECVLRPRVGGNAWLNVDKKE